MRRPRDRVADAVGVYPRLKAMAGIDTIWPYQFIVYLGFLIWGLYSFYFLAFQNKKPDSIIFFTPGTAYWYWLWSFIASPPVVFTGYLLRNKYIGVILSFSGNSAMAWAMWTYTATLFISPKITALSSICVALLSACITVRAVRDILLIRVIRRETQIAKLGRHSRERRRKEDKRLL